MIPTQDDTAFFGKRNIFALFIGSGVFVIAYLIMALLGGEYGSALLFAAMPLASAFIVGMLAPARKMIFGTCFFSLMINLVLSPFMLAEGLFCVVMAAPIFCVVTAIAALAAWLIRREPTQPRPNKNIPAKLMLLILASIGGASVWDEIVLHAGAPIETVRTEVEISASRGEVWNRLTFDRASAAKVPLWLRLWVAQPERYAFNATGVGARRETDFGPPHYGDDADAIRNKLVYEITEWRENEACAFQCRENHSRMRKWLDLLDTRVEFSDGSAAKTRVVFTTRYRRKIGPSLYFTPFLSAAVRGLHDMLAQEIGAVSP